MAVRLDDLEGDVPVVAVCKRGSRKVLPDGRAHRTQNIAGKQTERAIAHRKVMVNEG